MKTIELIKSMIEQMEKLQIPANLNIGTFEVEGKGTLHNSWGNEGQYIRSDIKFILRFKPSHIQHLLELKVKINLNEAVMADLSPNAKRFKKGREAIKQGNYAPYYYMGDPENYQTGVIDNWLDAPASCDLPTLLRLNEYCRENHRDKLCLHNDTVLKNAGWNLDKIKYNKEIPIESQYFNIRAIRIHTQGKKANTLQPIEKRVLNMY